MNAIATRLKARVSALACATLLLSTFSVSTAPEAKGAALVFVLFSLNAQAYVMRSDGSDAHTMGTTTQAASRDSHLAYYDAASGINEVLWRLNGAEGGRIVFQSPLTTGVAGKTVTEGPGNDGFPAISSTGTIAFVSDRDGDNEIYTIGSDGSGLLQLTDNTSDDSEPSWAPDGSIAFTSDRDGDRDIWRMDADGTDQVKLAFNSAAADFHPRWAPDGSGLLITSERSGDQDIWLLHADLSDPLRLTTGSSDETDGVWSPDGSQIFYSSDADGDFDIYVMSLTGELIDTLTVNDTDDHVMDATDIPPMHVRGISMSVGAGGLVKGRVTDQFSMPGCFRRSKVVLYRKKVGGWQPLAETKTDSGGGYQMDAGDGARSLALRVKVLRSEPAVPLRDIVCSGAEARS